MTRNDPEIRDLLAAEYALGTLHGAARRRFAHMLRSDAGLQDLVQFWDDRLAALASHLPPETPRDQVWQAIQNRLGFEKQSANSLSAAVPAWMRIGRYVVSAAALVMMVVGVQVMTPPAEDGSTGATLKEPVFVAEVVIENEWGGAQWRIRGNPGDRRARLEVIQTPKVGEDRDLEMWFIADASSAPVSLWLCPDEPGAFVDLELAAPMTEGSTFAVSLEPVGGSPEPGPTGPVLFAATYTG